MHSLMNVYNKCLKLPAGKRIFSKLVCLKAPYFGTIKPLFKELRPGYCEITMKNRRAVHNHIKSVHAIAMCNISELAAGTSNDCTCCGYKRSSGFSRCNYDVYIKEKMKRGTLFNEK